MIDANKLLQLEEYAALPLGCAPRKGRMVKAQHLGYLRELLERIAGESRDIDELERRAEDAEAEATDLEAKLAEASDEVDELESKVDALTDLLREVVEAEMDSELRARIVKALR